MEGYAKEEYYHVVDVPIYHDFYWIGQELPRDSVTLLNPYVGWAYVTISGQYAYTSKAYPWGVEEASEITHFFLTGATDTEYLKERNIRILWSPFPLKNPDLVEVRGGLYILREGR
jgi:hypothetical protein